MAAGGDEARLVEPRADLVRCVPVQLEKLDTLVPLRTDAAQRAFEVAVAFRADRVELQADAWRGHVRAA